MALGPDWVAASRAPTDEWLREVFAKIHRVGVLGIHSDPERAAFYVPEYLHDAGYEIVGTNPAQGGQTLFGSEVRATLAELGTVDVIDVFRRAEALPAHLPELIAARPKLVWLQTGIRHAEVAEALRAAGIACIEDRCMLADHQRLVR